MSTPPIALAGLRRIAIRAPNWLGDTVMALPTIRALRAAAPHAELWCVGRWVVPLLEAEEGIARRLHYPPGWVARWRQAIGWRRSAIDLALLLPNSFESALAMRLAGARWRVGYAGDGRRALLTHPVAQAGEPVHQVEAYLRLLGTVGLRPETDPPTLRIAAGRQEEARRLLAEVGVRPGEPAVGIQLGSAYGPSKRWPSERIAALAGALTAHGVVSVFLGGPEAAPLLGEVRARLPARPRSLVGRDHPALLPALMAGFSAVIASDTGPAHVAAAVGVPTVVLFGPTDPRLTAPVGGRHAAIWRRPTCAPCFLTRCPIDHRCMRGIDVDTVLAAVLDRLPRVPAPPAGERP